MRNLLWGGGIFNKLLLTRESRNSYLRVPRHKALQLEDHTILYCTEVNGVVITIVVLQFAKIELGTAEIRA